MKATLLAAALAAVLPACSPAASTVAPVMVVAVKPAAPRSVPAVKPTDLMRWCIRLVAPVGSVVFDPFMGSGSTGKAAMLEGFRFVGAELSPEYFEIACRRVEAAYKAARAQPTLFDEIEATGRKAADILQPSFF